MKFNMIGIFVSNLAQMVGFYRDAIGIPIDWKDDGSPYAEFSHEGIRFSMFARSELSHLLGQPPAFPDGLNGTFELALNVGQPENVDTKFAQVVASGGRVIYAPRDEPWKMRSAMIADPEGNLIEIASDFWE